MGNDSIAARVQELAEQVAIDHGLELVHAEVAGPENKPIVRIFIDKPQGVTHEDCSEVSNHLGTVLDVEDFIHASYTLEVSSPGIERPLHRAADWRRFVGQRASVLSPMLHGRAEVEILGVEGSEGAESVVLRTAQGIEQRIALADVKDARLAFTW